MIRLFPKRDQPRSMSLRIRRVLPTLITLSLIALLAVITITRTTPAPWIRVLPPSMPGGWYWVHPADSLQHGDAVLVCVSLTQAAQAIERGYAHPSQGGACPDSTSGMVKLLAALPGDTVTVTRQATRIHGRVVVVNDIAQEDAQGREMDNAVGQHVLAAGECFVMSTYHPNSWDSRYYGPVPCAGIPWTVTPMSSTAADTVAALTRQLRGE